MKVYNLETVIRKSGIIVLPDDMKVLEKHRVRLTLVDMEKSGKSDKQEGLASAMGKWEKFDEIADVLTDISSIRSEGGFGKERTTFVFGLSEKGTR